MTRPSAPRANGRDTAQRIEDIALQLFHEQGFHGTSIRELAGGAGIGIATLFHHGQSKVTILERLINDIVDRLYSELKDAIADREDPIERLTAAARRLALIHCEWQRESFVAFREMRSLPPEQQQAILHKRAEIQRIFTDALEAAARDGRADCEPRETGRAIVSMIVMIATWYRPGHDKAPEEIAETYVGMALRLAGAEDPARARVASIEQT